MLCALWHLTNLPFNPSTFPRSPQNWNSTSKPNDLHVLTYKCHWFLKIQTFLLNDSQEYPRLEIRKNLDSTSYNISIKHVIRQAAWSGEICFNSQRGKSKSFSMWPQFAPLRMPAGRSIVFGHPIPSQLPLRRYHDSQSTFHLNTSATWKGTKLLSLGYRIS